MSTRVTIVVAILLLIVLGLVSYFVYQIEHEITLTGYFVSAPPHI